MVTRDDVESFLHRMELDVEEVDEGMWLARNGSDGAGVVVNHSPPVLVFRAKVLDIPKDEKKCAELFQRLLELNATDLVHGAYAIEEGDVILTEALELENLDFNEFQTTVDSIQMAMAAHVEELAPYRNC
jgi:hypothetical protein